ncbi:MAG: cation:proton antiporter [Thermomicrobiales bacterium]
MDWIELFVVLLLISAIAAVAARRLRLQYTLVLLILGLLLGASGLLPQLDLTSELILLLFLPPLLFEAAFALDLALLWRQRRGVLTLALPGTLLATLIGGALVAWAGILPPRVAFVFGAMIAATDPVAVLATFRQLRASPELTVLMEGESLFNDGIALSLFLTLVAATTGTLTAPRAIGDFLLTVLGGALLGLLIGWLGHYLIALVDEHLIEMTVSVAVAYGAFLAAEHLHLSGVIATLAAAMTLSRLGRTRGWVLSDNSERLLDDLWTYLAFVANAALFLLMGLAAPGAGITTYPGHVLWGILAALLGRAVVAYLLGSLPARLGFCLTWPERHIVFWGGLRGAVALAAALSLPHSFPARPQLLAMTYGVVLFTTLIQGLTIAPLARRLGIVIPPSLAAD